MTEPKKTHPLTTVIAVAVILGFTITFVGFIWALNIVSWTIIAEWVGL